MPLPTTTHHNATSSGPHESAVGGVWLWRKTAAPHFQPMGGKLVALRWRTLAWLDMSNSLKTCIDTKLEEVGIAPQRPPNGADPKLPVSQ